MWNLSHIYMLVTTVYCLFLRIVLNWAKSFTEFNFTSVSLYWIIISYELRYVVLRICVWENTSIENIPEAAFHECSLQWLLLQYGKIVEK